MGGPAAEQIIAGVVLGERLAVTMYGAIHRAQHGGQRNLRGLIVDAKMLAEDGFRRALTDAAGIRSVIGLDHETIVPAVAVESEGADVVVVTRGTGRFVTAHDLIAAARAGGARKLSPEITALIGKSVVAALAIAHAAGVVHGAVHPRSVLIDELGDVRLGDFVVGRALTTAVAQGADSSLWRGLAGYIAPELVVGEDPTPAVDVYAVGALLFTLLTGEVQPGSLHVTPAVERLVTRALDTDVTRRYGNAKDLLENLLEAFEDDHWGIADKAELIKVAGLAHPDTNLDDATEDLLASLGSSAVQVTPTRPSMDIRAEAISARHQRSPQQTTGGRLEALLADLGDDSGMTQIEDEPFRRDPVSEIIQLDPRKAEAVVQPRRRVPSLDDADDEAEPPRAIAAPGAARSQTLDEASALDALNGLDEPARRMSSAAEQVTVAADRLEAAAKRAEAAAVSLESNPVKPTPAPVSRAVAIVDPIDVDAPPVKLRSPVARVIGGLVVVGVIAVGGYLVMTNFTKQADIAAVDKVRQDQLTAEREKAAAEKSRLLGQAQIDPGAIVVTSTPSPAGVWLRLGRTPLDSMRLAANTTHEIAVISEGHLVGQAQIVAANWETADKGAVSRKATVAVRLEPAKPDPKTKKLPSTELPIQPKAVHASQVEAGQGPIHIESTPSDAEVWLFIGHTGDEVKFNSLTAGREYELLVVKPGTHKPKRISIKPDEWRDGGDPNIPIDVAAKKAVIERAVELEAVKPEKR